MAYKIEKKGKAFILFNEGTGRVVASHKTKEKAIAQGREIDVRERRLRNVEGKVEMNIEEEISLED